MSLALDPVLAADYDEPPYSPRQERVYAPAAPFAEAIEEWLNVRKRRNRTAVADPRTTGARAHHRVGTRELAARSGVDTRQIARYLTGEAAWIHLNNADKLALAMNIPLWNLADEFKTMPAWRREAA